MARNSIKLFLNIPPGVTAMELEEAVKQWSFAQEHGQLLVHRQAEHDDYFRTRNPDIVLKSRRVTTDAASTPASRNRNLATGEGRAGSDGEVIMIREGLQRDILLLPFLSREHGHRLSTLMEEGMAYDLSVDKERVQLSSDKGWYVNLDYLPWMERNGRKGAYFIEIQTDQHVPSDVCKRLADSFTANLQQAHSDWNIAVEPLHYREMMRNHLAAEPLRIARENTWLRAMSAKDVEVIQSTPPLSAKNYVLRQGLTASGEAFIVHSGIFDVYLNGRRVRSFQAGEVFGDIGPLAQEFGFVGQQRDGATLRFGDVRAREGTDAKIIPISRPLLNDLCRCGALDGFRSIIKQYTNEWSSQQSRSR